MRVRIGRNSIFALRKIAGVVGAFSKPVGKALPVIDLALALVLPGGGNADAEKKV